MNNIKSKNVLVTGGAGFIGSHLCDQLIKADAKKIICIDNLFLGNKKNLTNSFKHKEKFIFYNSDASEFHSLESIIDREKPEIIFNLATKALMYSFENPYDACNVNIQIALNLAQILRKKKFKKLVQISTSEVYGSATSSSINEDHPLRPETSYAAGKAGADLALISYINQFNLDILILRPFNNFGPRQNFKKYAAVIPLTIKNILERKKPLIKGTGRQTRDFIYVKDTVDNILKLSQKKIGEKIINLASGCETKIIDIVNKISLLMDYNKGFVFQKRRVADVNRHKADITIFKKNIKQLKFTSLEEGLKQTISWYKELG